MQQVYVSLSGNRDQGPKQGRKLFVGGIPRDMPVEAITSYFEKFGKASFGWGQGVWSAHAELLLLNCMTMYKQC